ncbi:MAG: PIN domain-containing protein [Coriobacteriia bacterium]|nr:PIN domain-containing protein [Coriobacteriia bacterium]
MTLRVLLDTNVILDYIFKRKPFFDDADQVIRMTVDYESNPAMSASSVTDVFYLINRMTHSRDMSRKLLDKLLFLVKVVDTTADDIYCALGSDMEDYEDAVVAQVALSGDFDYIVTRNTRDFLYSPVPAITPKDLLKKFHE